VDPARLALHGQATLEVRLLVVDVVVLLAVVVR
jgi:hypothetical protein